MNSALPPASTSTLTFSHLLKDSVQMVTYRVVFFNPER